MQIKRIKVGYLETNCYIVEQNNKCLIIDPGEEKNKIIECIGLLNPIGIIITHYHFDHIKALDDIKNKYNIPIYDIYNLKEGTNKIDEFYIEIIYTKGHDNTSITLCLKEEQIMFTGDFIFKDSIGRFDFLDSNKKEMIKSISKIKEYPEDYLIYPGHGETTTLQYEKENNYYFNNDF